MIQESLQEASASVREGQTTLSVETSDLDGKGHPLRKLTHINPNPPLARAGGGVAQQYSSIDDGYDSD